MTSATRASTKGMPNSADKPARDDQGRDARAMAHPRHALDEIGGKDQRGKGTRRNERPARRQHKRQKHRDGDARDRQRVKREGCNPVRGKGQNGARQQEGHEKGAQKLGRCGLGVSVTHKGRGAKPDQHRLEPDAEGAKGENRPVGAQGGGRGFDRRAAHVLRPCRHDQQSDTDRQKHQPIGAAHHHEGQGGQNGPRAEDRVDHAQHRRAAPPEQRKQARVEYDRGAALTEPRKARPKQRHRPPPAKAEKHRAKRHDRDQQPWRHPPPKGEHGRDTRGGPHPMHGEQD